MTFNFPSSTRPVFPPPFPPPLPCGCFIDSGWCLSPTNRCFLVNVCPPLGVRLSLVYIPPRALRVISPRVHTQAYPGLCALYYLYSAIPLVVAAAVECSRPAHGLVALLDVRLECVSWVACFLFLDEGLVSHAYSGGGSDNGDGGVGGVIATRAL